MAESKSKVKQSFSLPSCRAMLMVVAFLFNELLHALCLVLVAARSLFVDSSTGLVGDGVTVLVTTGRQAKTLHVVRALKAVGCRVVVTDYTRYSASAVSVDCDAFEVLPSVQDTPPEQWVRHLRAVLERHGVAVVVPVSTINEVLPMALAKDVLSTELPQVRWMCPGLQEALLLDDRARFASVCSRYEVRAPPSGVVHTREEAVAVTARSTKTLVFKRIESSVNRAEEVVFVKPDAQIPACVAPYQDDPWQWQHEVCGTEKSAWYVCEGGRVTLSGCYYSQASMTAFDPALVPQGVDAALRRLVRGLQLTGQYAFDFIEDVDGKAHVLECNPRASSVLETVSGTPVWGEAFFGVCVEARKREQSVGFAYHRGSAPWSARRDGHFALRDPLPVLAAQVAWPVHAVATVGMLAESYVIDVNICKIIVAGSSPPRNLAFFRDAHVARLAAMGASLARSADTLILDAAVPDALRVRAEATARGTSVVLVRHAASGAVNGPYASPSADGAITVHKLDDAFFAVRASGETRALLAEPLAAQCGSDLPVTYRVVTPRSTLMRAAELPMRTRRVLHVIGARSSDFYADLSALYGFQCVSALESSLLAHLVAFIHRDGTWSVGAAELGREYFESEAPRLRFGDAVVAIERLNIDVVQPHMFDLAGMTTYRALFDALDLPALGCGADAMALSTNKVRTKAVAAAAGVPVVEGEMLRRGEMPTMAPPLIVKPVEEDNSVGVSLVRAEDELASALDRAFAVDDTVLCERFVPLGRELRVAVLEDAAGELALLPVLEYHLSAERPIRAIADKLATDKEGKVTALAKKLTTVPAVVDKLLLSKLQQAAFRAHRALGCRDYSIFDVRVDPDGQPFFLESCLYCSFAQGSLIVSLAKARGIALDVLFQRVVEWALTRRSISGAEQKIAV